MIRDANEFIQQFLGNMQKFVEEQSRQASALKSQVPDEQIGAVVELLGNIVEKLEELGSRIQKVEERVGFKTEFPKKEPVEHSGLIVTTHQH